MKTLYGDTKISEYINNDKSPKGSVDEKIRPLVNLINLHPEFVTLSSCSGRVAMFDPVGYADDIADGNEITASDETNNTAQNKVVKGTELSGKGRGKWIFVTHDVLPDLGKQVIDALRKAGMHRRQMNNDTNTSYDSVVTYKHEPPLLHIAASSLAAGKKLLHLAKSTCAMRESGLVVTDQRVTVELRTTGALLCLPLMVQSDTCIQPDENYLMALADMSNKRMKQNSVLLEKLYDTIENELFEDKTSCQTQEEECAQFNVSLEPLPPLNLWKSASVAISSPSQTERTICECIHVLAIGGQGIGPNVEKTGGKAPCCRRWDAIFCLTRKDGTWANNWKQISIMNEAGFEENLTLETSVGLFQVDCKVALGAREGHTAIVMPSSRRSLEDGVVIFGGRTGMSPSNDLFLFKMYDADKGVLGRPIDVRGSPPIPRYGHTMNALSAQDDNDTAPLAVVSGGRSKDATLSCIHIISRSIDNDTGKCHLVWERIDDMPNPRCYHAAELIADKRLFIYGGTSDLTDPFSSSSTNSSWFIQPIHRAANGEHTTEVAISNDVKLPKLVGAAICSCYKESEENNLMLLSGGVLDQESHDTTIDQAPFHIINWNFEADGTLLRPEMATYSVTGSEKIKDLGSMVHHNLLKLPRSSNESISAALFGGGVPSFSFGQSFSR